MFYNLGPRASFSEAGAIQMQGCTADLRLRFLISLVSHDEAHISV